MPLVRGVDRAEQERRALAFAQCEGCRHAGVRRGERGAGSQREGQAGRTEDRPVPLDPRLVLVARVVEPRPALHAELETAAYDANKTDQAVNAVAVRGRADGHEVDDLAHAVGRQEARDEHVGVGPVELLGRQSVAGRRDAEVAAFLVVEDRGKHAGRVEVGVTEPVDGPVLAHQRDGTHVADDAVVLDGLVCHGPSLAHPLP